MPLGLLKGVKSVGLRRQSREAALQAVFACDFLGVWSMEQVNFCFSHYEISPAIRSFSCLLCQGVIENLKELEASITRASDNWSISRMGRVDRCILRLAAYEIMFMVDVPANVSMNEAIEIAKRFGSDESPQFINGVLDKLTGMTRGQPDFAARALQRISEQAS